jgi:putative nucleotidyltransferase with HDIG domain
MVSQSVNQEDATLLILDQLEKVMDYDSATVQLVENEGIRVDAVRGPEQESLLNQVYQTSEKEIIQSILLDVEAVVVDDLKQLENWIEFPGSQGVRSWLGVPLIARGKKIGVLTLAHQEVGYYSEEDLELVTAFASQAAITLENKRLFEEAQRRLSRLSALRDIDQTIIGSLDVKLTLRVLLDQLVKELRVDAVDVYLFDSLWTTLDYAVSRGFREEAYLDALSLEDGLIGTGLVKNKLIRIPDLQSADIDHVRKEHFAREGFVSYFGLPLVAKGELVGILEVFQRQLIKPDPEWLDFLNALAGQAAISIDRLNLYLELKQSNMELVQAYDETIASLARALELRDMETQGHCQRVESLTLQLARECGVDSEDLLYLRWGALLHDLGKIGIPDRILHKPGKLTEEEWEIMREHPEYAYEMLSSIDYLSPALDIPRYHHERWDGSGYPEGLAGERIPLPARIFAVVDVWDALRSDRPYRKAWSDQRAREYLEEMAGKEFDPLVVERFLNLLGETNSRVNLGQDGCGGRDDQS